MLVEVEVVCAQEEHQEVLPTAEGQEVQMEPEQMELQILVVMQVVAVVGDRCGGYIVRGAQESPPDR